MYELNQVSVPKDFIANKFINESFNERTPEIPFGHYILPGRLDSSEYHFSISEGIDGIVDEVHIKTEDAFCFLPKGEKVDLVFKMAESFLEYKGNYDAEIVRTIMHMPAERIGVYHGDNPNMSSEELNEALIYASARDWGTRWHQLANEANVLPRVLTEGAILLGAGVAAHYAMPEASFAIKAGAVAGAVAAGLLGVPYIETKKAKSLREIANSDVYISLE